MSAYEMKPTFVNWNGYQKWIQEWRLIYSHLSDVCKKRKSEIKMANRNSDWNQLKKLRENYTYDKVMATKMITLRSEAVIRWNNIKAMQVGLRKQYQSFPITIDDAKNIDFHFNKKHLEFPQIPMWTMKAKGQSFYINHLDCKIPWSTREKPEDKSTKGCIRIKRGNIHIDETGSATIS